MPGKSVDQSEHTIYKSVISKQSVRQTTVLHQGWQWAFHHTKNDPHGCEHNLCNCVSSPKKIQDFNRIWTHDPTIPVRCSNRLSYEATDVGSWSIMCSCVLVKEMNVIDVYETNHIRTAEMKSNEEWTLQLWTQFMQLRNKRKKNSGLKWDLNPWPRNLILDIQSNLHVRPPPVGDHLPKTSKILSVNAFYWNLS